MFKWLQGWSIRVFAGKYLKRFVTPLSGALVGAFTKFAPETTQTQGPDAAAAAAGFIVASLVELIREALEYMLKKRKEEVKPA